MALPLRQSPPRSVLLRVVLAAGATLVAGIIAALLLPHGLRTADVAGAPPGAHLTTPTDPHLAALMERYRCSTDGFGSSQVPASAIIRRPDGRVAVVSFDRGWDVFRADGPASLVTVCLRPAD